MLHSDRLVFPKLQEISAQMTMDSIHQILEQLPASRERSFLAAYFMQYKFDEVSRRPVTWVSGVLQATKKYDDPRLRFHLYRNLGLYYRDVGDFIQALDFFNAAEKLNEQLNIPSWTNANYDSLVRIHRILKNYKTAFEYAYKILDFNQVKSNKKGIGYAHFILGRMYYTIGEYKQATKEYDKARNIFEETNHQRLLARTELSSSDVYIKTSQSDSALISARRALEIFGNLNLKRQVGEANQKIGNVLLADKNYDDALSYLLRGDSLVAGSRIMYDSKEILGNAYYQMGDLQTAKKYYLEYLEAVQKNVNSVALPAAYQNLAKTYLKEKDYTNAKRYAILAKAEAQNQELEHKLYDINSILLDALYNLKDYATAYQINLENNQIRTEEEQLTKKRTAELNSLNYQLRNQRENLVKKYTLVENEKKWSKRMLWLIFIGGSIIFLLLIQNIRITDKRNQALRSKNKEINSLNKQLSYAVKEQKNALASSQAQLEIIYDNTQDLIGLLEIKEGYFYIESLNKPYLEKLNLTNDPEQIINKNYTTHLKEDFKLTQQQIEVITQNLAHVIVAKQRSIFEISLTEVADKESVIFEMVFTPVIQQYQPIIKQVIFSMRDITAKHQASKKLLESERKLSMVFNGAKDPTFIFDIKEDQTLILTATNQAFKTAASISVRNYKEQQMIGMSGYHFLTQFMGLTDFHAQQKLSFIWEIIANKKSTTYLEFLPNKMEEIFELEVTATPLLNDHGESEQLLFVSRNITKMLAAQKTLKQRESQLTSIYNSTPDYFGLIKLNHDGKHTTESFNKSVIDLLKTNGKINKETELINIPADEFFNLFGMPTEEVDKRMNLLNRMCHTPLSINYSSKIQLDDSRHPISFGVTISPVLDKDGTCTHALFSVRDTTEKQRAKEKLLRSQRRLSSVFNSTTDFMMILDINNNGELIVEETNKAFRNGWNTHNPTNKTTTFVNKRVDEVLKVALQDSPESVEAGMRLLHQVIKDNKAHNFEHDYITPDGKKFLIDFTIIPILEYLKNLKKLLVVARDVSLKQRASEQLISKILETEDRERSRLAKDLHDSLGQNLTAASINFNLVKKEMENWPSSLQQKFLAGIEFLQEAIEESRNIAHNLMPQSISDFGYVLTIESLLENLNESTALQFDFYSNLGDQRLFAEMELSLYRITQEAINNILKHANATLVTIQLIKHSHSLILTIEDNGQGFSPDNLKIEFGLNSMRNRVNAHSGTIDIDTREGAGTAITVELPLEPSRNLQRYI